MADPHIAAKALIAKLCPTAKDIKVFRSGGFLITFRGEDSARNALHLLAPVVKGPKIGQGYDDTGPRQYSKVWRIMGTFSA